MVHALARVNQVSKFAISRPCERQQCTKPIAPPGAPSTPTRRAMGGTIGSLDIRGSETNQRHWHHHCSADPPRRRTSFLYAARFDASGEP